LLADASSRITFVVSFCPLSIWYVSQKRWCTGRNQIYDSQSLDLAISGQNIKVDEGSMQDTAAWLCCWPNMHSTVWRHTTGFSICQDKVLTELFHTESSEKRCKQLSTDRMKSWVAWWLMAVENLKAAKICLQQSEVSDAQKIISIQRHE
jgi:hypothetical protein